MPIYNINSGPRGYLQGALPWRSQPQYPVAIDASYGIKEAFLAGRGVNNGVRLATGATEGALAATINGIGPTITASSAVDISTGVDVGASTFSVLMVVRPNAATRGDNLYCLRPTSATYGFAAYHASFGGRFMLYDGIAVNDPLLPVIGDRETAVIAFSYDGDYYWWSKDGVSGTPTDGNHPGTGAWRLISYTAWSDTFTWPLLAFSDKFFDQRKLNRLTSNPWQLFEAAP